MTSNLRLVSRKKDEGNENDDDMFGGGGSAAEKVKKALRRWGGGGGGGGLSKTSSGLLTSSQPSISERMLNFQKIYHGRSARVVSIMSFSSFATSTSTRSDGLKLQDVDAYAILDESSSPRKSETRAADARFVSSSRTKRKVFEKNQDDDTPSSSFSFTNARSDERFENHR